ncbi:MAG TPA: SH3 domain-containing protein [Phototrophicaceae bacterium]|nr:SH3 domain-containing protein [Phototrophicaceae bacterium]
MPRSSIKLALLSLPLLLLMGITILIVSACAVPAPAAPTLIPITLPANSETRIALKPGSAAYLYSVSAASATPLKLTNQTPGFAFAAQIRDAAGKMVADFDNQLQNIQFTLAPQTGAYQINIASSDPKAAGSVSLALGSAVIAPQPLDGTAFTAPDCHVTNDASVNVLVRTAPADQYGILGLLPANGSLAVLGRTDNNWYTVDFAERQGWVVGNAIALNGDCQNVPLVHNPTIPTAPADAPAFLLEVDRDGSGSFSDAISAPDGDTSDLIWVRIINLDTHPPNNYREFALSLDCKGTGVEAVRWGNAYEPNLKCGASIVLPFLNGNAQQPMAVLLPAGSQQSYIQYTLNVQPANAVG